jgi:AbrB family looped-hinge helix DNA binding protein
MFESVITRKGQVTIPKSIRERLNAREGQRVRFSLRGRDVILKVEQGTILDLKGSVVPPERGATTDTIRRAVKRAVAVRTARHG